MFDKLDNVEKRYEELNKLISDPEVIANQNEWKKLITNSTIYSKKVGRRTNLIWNSWMANNALQRYFSSIGISPIASWILILKRQKV